MIKSNSFFTLIFIVIFLIGCSKQKVSDKSAIKNEPINIEIIEGLISEDNFKIPSGVSSKPKAERDKDGSYTARSYSASGTNKYLWGEIQGYKSSVSYYDNQILVRLSIPNEKYNLLLAQMKSLFGNATKVNKKFIQWSVNRGDQISFLTVHCLGTKRKEYVNLPNVETFTFDITRMILE